MTGPINVGGKGYKFLGRVLFALLLVAALTVPVVRCGTEGDDDDDDALVEQELDDCGYQVLSVPAECDTCHGAPPQTSRHPDNHRCYRCHGYTVDENYEFVDSGMHRNGEVDYAVGCSSCHGWALGISPPQNLKGECDRLLDGVGSHAHMRRETIPAHQTACTNCHTVPLSTWAEGHIDGDGVAEVLFNNLATMKGAQPVWDGERCSNVYCHGATLEGGDYKDPVWLDDSGDASKCGACHRLTDPEGNADADCHSCHPTSVDENREILPRGDHINGMIDMGSDS